MNDLYTSTLFDGLWFNKNEPTGMGANTAGEIKPDDADPLMKENI